MSNQQQNKPVIGIDLLGNDNSPIDLLNDLLKYTANREDSDFVFLGTEDTYNYFLKNSPSNNMSFSLVKDTISIEDNPLFAIRRKKNSSISIGMKLLKEKKIDALVSAGNTGALMASAKMMLPMLPSISKAALLALVPTKKSPLVIIDVGANINCKASHLTNFAKIGIAFQKIRYIDKPIVALLNIGSEEKKGTIELRKAYQQLNELAKKNKNFSFLGNIEGKEVFNGDVNILVTDGFTGNIFLKTAEGLASFMLDKISESSNVNSIVAFEDLKKRLHYESYPGAILCGFDGIVVKCHSYSNSKAIIKAINGAIDLINKDFIKVLTKNLTI
jgi:phosphate acyltransferase